MHMMVAKQALNIETVHRFLFSLEIDVHNIIYSTKQIISKGPFVMVMRFQKWESCFRLVFTVIQHIIKHVLDIQLKAHLLKQTSDIIKTLALYNVYGFEINTFAIWQFASHMCRLLNNTMIRTSFHAIKYRVQKASHKFPHFKRCIPDMIYILSQYFSGIDFFSLSYIL